MSPDKFNIFGPFFFVFYVNLWGYMCVWLCAFYLLLMFLLWGVVHVGCIIILSKLYFFVFLAAYRGHLCCCNELKVAYYPQSSLISFSND